MKNKDIRAKENHSNIDVKTSSLVASMRYEDLNPSDEIIASAKKILTGEIDAESLIREAVKKHSQK